MKRGLYIFGISNYILATDDFLSVDPILFIDPSTIDNNDSEMQFVASAIDEITGTIVAATNRYYRSAVTYDQKQGVWCSSDWGDTWNHIDPVDVDRPESPGVANRGTISFGNSIFFSQDIQYSPFQYQGMKTSTDGINWIDTGYTAIWTYLWNVIDLIYFGSRWVASGVQNSSARGVISTTNNGQTWADAVGISSGGGDYVFISTGTALIAYSPGNSFDIWRSTDGHNWSKVGEYGVGSLSSMARGQVAVYDGTNIFIYDNGGYAAKSSDDGVSWTEVTVTGDGFYSHSDTNYDYPHGKRVVAYRNGTYVAIGSDQFTIKASSNGTTWVTVLDSNDFPSLYGGIHSIHLTDEFCAEFATLPQSNSFSSIADTERSYGATGQGYGLVPATVNNPNFGVGYKVTAGANGAVVRVDSIKIRLKYQLDVTQEQLESVRPQGYASVAIGQGSQVIVGAGGLILRSTDNGQNWSPVTAPIQSDFRKIVYEKNTYVATGSNGVIIKSTDEGVSWIAVNAGISSTVRSIAYHPSTGFVMSGKDGLSVSSKLLISWRFI